MFIFTLNRPQTHKTASNISIKTPNDHTNQSYKILTHTYIHNNHKLFK